MSKNKFFKKLLVAGLCALTATATIGGAVACKKDNNSGDDNPPVDQTLQRNITWNLDGGSWPANYTAPTKVDDGGKITEPTQKPTKTGKELDHWENAAVPGTPYNFNNTVDGDITLKAIWKNASSGNEQTYKVTIDLDGGTWEGQTVTNGKIVLQIEKDGDLTDLYAQLAKLTKSDKEYDKLVIKGQTAAYDWTEAITEDLDLVVLWKTPHVHVLATGDNWSKDASGHWYACTAEGCDNKDENALSAATKVAHVDADGNNKCDTCEYDGGALPAGYTDLLAKAGGQGGTTKLVANSFLTSGKLTGFTEWGTAGVYGLPASKSASSETNYVEAKEGKAVQVASGANVGTVVDFGEVGLGTVEGYLEFSVSVTGSKWNLVQFYNGEEPTDENLIFTLRVGTDKETLYYSTTKLSDGNGTDCDATYKIAANINYALSYKFDLATGKVTVSIKASNETNATVLLNEKSLGINALTGYRVVSGNSGARLVTVDNVIAVYTTVSLADYKTVLKADVAAVEALLPEELRGGAAKDTFDAAIDAASSTANCDSIYAAYYEATLTAYSNSVVSYKDTTYPSTDYNIADKNLTAYTNAVTAFTTSVEGATTIEAITAAKTALDSAMENVFPNSHYDQTAVNITISDGTTSDTISRLPGEKVTEDDILEIITVDATHEIIGYYTDSAMTAEPITLPYTVLSTTTAIYVKVEAKTVNDYESWFVEMTEDDGTTASATTYAANDVIYDDDNTLFTLSAGVASKYSIGKQKGALQTTGHVTTFTDQKGNTYNPDQGICFVSGVAKCTCDATTGEITAPGSADNLYKVTAKEDCTVYLYLSMTNDSFNSNRPGTITYTIGDNAPVSQEWKADRGAVVALAITLEAGETASIGVTCSSVSEKNNVFTANSANLWLFGAEAVKKGVTITPPATGDTE